MKKMLKIINERNMRRVVFTSLLVLFASIGFVLELSSQEPGLTEMKQVFRKFKNYRFGSVALYQVNNIQEIRKAIEAKEMASSGTAIVDDSALEGIPEPLKKAVENYVRVGQAKEEIANNLFNDNIEFETDQLNTLYDYYIAREGDVGLDVIENVFLITTKPKRGQRPETIIAMITSIEASSKLKANLKNVSTSNIYVHDELHNFELDSSYSATNMYDLLVNAFVQMNVTNKTTAMQGIGTPGFFYTKKFGITQSLASDEANLSDYDVQKYLKISKGEPHNLGLNQNEVILSPDLIAWRHYKLPMYWDGEYIVDSMGNANSDLPEYGLEIKYGIDDINYSSFWSERLTAYALWKSVKLGVILPTAGWANLSTELFDQTRSLTHGSVGVAGEFDFPIKVVPKSGVFRLSFGYVFGDAVEADYKDRDLTVDYSEFGMDPNLYTDFMIRSNFNLHYTFALAVDQDYQFRFGFGGTGYGVEQWYYDQVQDENGNEELDYKMFDDDFIFGMSARAEFMVKNISTPYGASIQYFDEAISGGIWLQLPVWENKFAVRLEAKGFSPLFRDKEHSWEVGGIFTPMARFIVNF